MPAELRLAWQAASYRALPVSGGLLDQPAGLLSRMTQVYNAWAAYHSYRQWDPEKLNEWAKVNPDLHALKITLDRLRRAIEDEHHANS